MKTPRDGRAPLRPAAFHILLALSAGPLHGLGIADEIERMTDGALQLGPGTLYRSLKELAKGGAIREVRVRDAGDSRRRHYAMTETGRLALEADAVRYERLSRIARRRRVISASAGS